MRVHRAAAAPVSNAIVLAMGVLTAGGASAQATEVCPSLDGTIGALEVRVTCLEEQVEALQGSQKVLERTIISIFQVVEGQSIEIRGPERFVELIPGSDLAVTHSYWAGGGGSQTFDCVPPVTPREGFVVFGAALGPELSGLGRGCSAEGHCDSTGEACTNQTRERGCFVNVEWWDWAHRQFGAEINYDTVCE